MDTKNRKIAGQAAVEFVIALLALVLIISGGVFLFQLNTKQRDMTTTLRGEAGHNALSALPNTSTAPYIRDWDDGPDGRPGTADDIMKNGDAGIFITLANYGAPADQQEWWDMLNEHLKDAAPNRAHPSFLNLRENPMPMSSLEFLHREDNASVKVDRFLQQTVIPRETITVKHEVYFPSCSNLY